MESIFWHAFYTAENPEHHLACKGDHPSNALQNNNSCYSNIIDIQWQTPQYVFYTFHCSLLKFKLNIKKSIHTSQNFQHDGNQSTEGIILQPQPKKKVLAYCKKVGVSTPLICLPTMNHFITNSNDSSKICWKILLHKREWSVFLWVQISLTRLHSAAYILPDWVF